MTAELRAGARWWDGAALTLVVGGAALYARAASGMQQVAATPITNNAFVDSNLAAWNHHRLEGNAALAIAAAGVALGIYSYYRSRPVTTSRP